MSNIRGVFGKYVDKCNRMRIKYARTLRTVLMQFLEFCVVVCIFDDFIERWVYFDWKNYRHYQQSV